MRETPDRRRYPPALPARVGRYAVRCLTAVALIVLLGTSLDWWRYAALYAAGPAGAASPQPTAGRRGATWQWPLARRPPVTRGFDPPATPYGPGHRGVDLAGRVGAPVRAAGDGIVGYAGLLAGRGVVTVLHAGGLRTTYEPVLAVVRRGQRVRAGQVLGRLAAGHRGCPVTACLHWGLLRGGTYLDPLALFGLGEVRLLPLANDSGSWSPAA